jgi:hypothetical protein
MLPRSAVCRAPCDSRCLPRLRLCDEHAASRSRGRAICLRTSSDRRDKALREALVHDRGRRADTGKPLRRLQDRGRGAGIRQEARGEVRSPRAPRVPEVIVRPPRPKSRWCHDRHPTRRHWRKMTPNGPSDQAPTDQAATLLQRTRELLLECRAVAGRLQAARADESQAAAAERIADNRVRCARVRAGRGARHDASARAGRTPPVQHARGALGEAWLREQERRLREDADGCACGSSGDPASGGGPGGQGDGHTRWGSAGRMLLLLCACGSSGDPACGGGAWRAGGRGARGGGARGEGR